ncbi:TolC-like outer membrane efflux protein [Campylobacter iguaniorum]|uniref:TolC family protein n=1 Tax=Campylobacter iguaniorum TaxID=1244531 RepID=UPI0007C8A7E6|nr:TolC family protein [Campylobacter iguaniorum]ANE36088.1 TolC-like outer membrane efflux protein [Campylobacter iguaniorum]
MKNILVILLGFLFVGCAAKSLNYEVKEVSFYEPVWYMDFNQSTLNSLVKTALKNNEDVSMAALSLRQALLKAGVAKDDLFPTAQAGAKATTSRDISTSNDWKNGFSSNFSLSYELDIFGKILDNYDARLWDAKTSELDLQNLKLTIVNSVVDTYFNILYVNDVVRNLELNLENLKSLDELVRLKYELGKEEILSVRQSKQNILNVQNQLLSQKRAQESNYEILKNLTRSEILLDKFSLEAVQTTDIGLEIKFEELGKRPDINAAISKLNSSFYDYKISEKNLYPSVSLGASLSDSASKFSDSFGFNILGGNLNINLPFLDYSRLKKQINISELEFRKNVLGYEKALSNAANEVIKYVGFYDIDKKRYLNFEQIKEHNQKIVEIYENKYDFGRVELKDLLEAKNALISAQNSLLNQKYLLLNDELNYYKAIAK